MKRSSGWAIGVVAIQLALLLSRAAGQSPGSAANALLNPRPAELSTTALQDSSSPASSGVVGAPSAAEAVLTERGSGGRGRFIAGAEIVVAMPWFEDNVSLTVLTNGRNDREVRSFGHEFEATPRVWLGYMTEKGIGVRARYWMFDHLVGQDSAPDPGPGGEVESVLFSGSNITESIFKLITLDGDTLVAAARLRTDVLDLESFIDVALGDLRLIPSAGLRYAHLSQRFRGHILDGGGNIAETDFGDLVYDGLGVTMGVQGVKPLGRRLSAFAGARASTLFGRTEETKVFDSTRTADKSFYRKTGELLVILESSAGAEWSRPLASGGRLFLRASVDSQVWANGGNLQADVNSFGFLGLGAAVGLNY